ncbi:MAG: aldo/keto reductase [Bilifractor sp.]|jgi:aryl-alcohol dehydrogenase-like predicted oxidoreductase
MKYSKIQGVDKPVSRIFYGTATMPFFEGGDEHELFDAMYGLGITAYDTARNYQLSEKSLGNWIDLRGNREKIVVLSKCGHPADDGRKRINEKEMRADLAQSLEYLKTDYIDIYLLHRDDPEMPVGTIVEILNAIHAEGKIRAFGGSNWTYRRIEEANEYAYKKNLLPFTVSSPNYGLADQVRDPWGGGCVSVSGPANQDARDWYTKNQMPVIAFSSLGRGMFSGKVRSTDKNRVDKILDEFAVKGYVSDDNFERLRRCEILAGEKKKTVSQIAMAYLFTGLMNTFAIVSTRSPERMRTNIEALDIELTEKERAWLDLRRDSL